jgi:hypothetical protein
MDALRQLRDDERFEKRLQEEAGFSAEEKRKRLRQVDNAARQPARAEIEDGQRFDRLEFPTDVPVMPQYGSVLPSQRWRSAGVR